MGRKTRVKAGLVHYNGEARTMPARRDWAAWYTGPLPSKTEEQPMPAVSVEPAPLKVSHKFTLEEYHRLSEAGILHEDDRVELIEGELIDLPPIGHVHAGLANRLNRFFTPRLLDRATPCIQNPVNLGTGSEPQPNFALLRFREDDYSRALPTAADVLLLVEIADSSLAYDREIKTSLYARHNIPEYWIIDIPHRRIDIHFSPDRENARYRERRRVSEGSLAPTCFPDLLLDVAELLR